MIFFIPLLIYHHNNIKISEKELQKMKDDLERAKTLSKPFLDDNVFLNYMKGK